MTRGDNVKNPGKAFEEDFKNSIPEDILYIRLKDGGGWSNGTNTRFTVKNECDAILFREPYLYMLEFKSHKGKSLPLSCISYHQLKSLNSMNKYKFVAAGFVINFRDLEETYFIHTDYIYQFAQEMERKSIPYDFVRDRGYRVQQRKKKVRYAYDVEQMLIDVI